MCNYTPIRFQTFQNCFCSSLALFSLRTWLGQMKFLREEVLASSPEPVQVAVFLRKATWRQIISFPIAYSPLAAQKITRSRDHLFIWSVEQLCRLYHFLYFIDCVCRYCGSGNFGLCIVFSRPSLAAFVYLRSSGWQIVLLATKGNAS